MRRCDSKGHLPGGGSNIDRGPWDALEMILGPLSGGGGGKMAGQPRNPFHCLGIRLTVAGTGE